MRHLLAPLPFLALLAAACAQPTEAPARIPAPSANAVAWAGTACGPTKYTSGANCHATAEAACQAAGCDTCMELETAPVQVVCQD